jgi:hypothetical protein
MANFNSRPWIKAAISLLLLLLIALGIYYPSAVPWLWHLRYPNGVHYHSTDIYVPPQWIAEENGLTVRLTKYPKTVFELIPQGLISLTPASETPAVDGESNPLWEANFREQHAAGETVIKGPVKYGSGAKESVCLESYATTNPSRISASCRLLQGEWTMEFAGHPKDLDFFFENFNAMNRK